MNERKYKLPPPTSSFRGGIFSLLIGCILLRVSARIEPCRSYFLKNIRPQ